MSANNLSGPDIPPTGHDLTLECRVTAKENGQELLALLAKRFPYYDLEKWRQAIVAGLVSLNGNIARNDQRVGTGDLVGYLLLNHQEPIVSTEIEEVFENEDLLLVGKPAGTPVSRTGLIVYNTFVNILRRRYRRDIHLLHRLDRETSGLLLCVKDKALCGVYQKELARVLFGKYYLAVVRGQFGQEFVTVDQPLATRVDSPVRCQMWPSENGKPCRTAFSRIAGNNDFSLVLAELSTGRKHQIRAHLAFLGHPLVGDKIYDHEGKYFLKRIGGDLTERDYDELGAFNHALHAWALRLKPPGQPEGLYFSRLFSDDMQKYLDRFPGWEHRAADLLETLVVNIGNKEA